MEKINDLKLNNIANYEGNWSELLFNRIQNSIIKGQLVDLLYQDEITKPDPLSKEEIEQYIDKRLNEVMSKTQIDFSESQPTSKVMRPNWKNPYTVEILTTKQLSITESHEKGHSLRPFESDFFIEYFSPAFDKDKVILTDEDNRVMRAELLKRGKEKFSDESDENIKEEYLKYLFSGQEVAERMSQLKNYFGMVGSEKFTKDQLEYARIHYVRDVGFDNGMSHFFEAITPETEDKFIELINKSGI